jgi:hypothetical protein
MQPSVISTLVSPATPGRAGPAGTTIRAPNPSLGQLGMLWDGASLSFPSCLFHPGWVWARPALPDEKNFIFHDGTVALWHAMEI